MSESVRDARRLAQDFGEALCSEFVALLESECRFSLSEAQYAARCCFDQADAIFPWPEADDE